MPSADARESGRLLLAASYTVIGYFLPYHLQRLSQLYPNPVSYTHLVRTLPSVHARSTLSATCSGSSAWV